MSKKELITHIENRTATLGKRSVSAWNRRNDVVSRIHVDLSPLNQESLVFVANSLNSKN
jgi:hypothetical protein